MRIRKTVTALALAAAVGGTTLAAAPAAQAGAYGCTRDGVTATLVYTKSVPTISGGTGGELRTYWDGYANCSVFVKSAYAGTKTWTYLFITDYNGDGGGSTNAGDFATYAGPVWVRAVNECIRERIVMHNPSGSTIVDYTTPWHSCG
ncbi:hypothetical protein ACIRBX_00055 [Kitasatospora sp. NPDC096147]|uniref:hypothetical protein n=1 Tax=Kitasatospora sp. NPDC096147 TaxID=3364093 RepID=UPI003821118D